MYAMIDVVDAALPRDRPRYLMGVGFPDDLLAGIQRGVDLFDCVAPTRMGRNGTAFTSAGRVNVRRAELRNDPGPLDAAGATAPPAPGSHAPTSGTCSRRTKCWGPACSRCTMYIF